MTVLFCFLAGFMTMPAHAAIKANITIINNASLVTGQTLHIRQFKTVSGKDKLVKKLDVGPVDVDCNNGCGALPGNFSAEAGTYRIEIGSDASPISSVVFTAKPGEEFVWMISNRVNPPTVRIALDDVVTTQDGPFRIDLVTHTPPMPGVAAAASAPRKKKPSGFWPFKPNNNPDRRINR